MIGWINFAVLITAMILFAILYTMSTMPVTRSESRGDKAWKECQQFRLFASVFELVILLTTICWVWFPVEELSWQISSYWWLGIVIGTAIFIPGSIIMALGVRYAGKESLSPSKETEMYGGIYKYIRHPQTLGEMPMFIAIAFAVNSWFLVGVMTLFVMIYTPVMLYFEEKDLVKRFGEAYKAYQQETGALFPKLKSFRRKEKMNEKR